MTNCVICGEKATNYWYILPEEMSDDSFDWSLWESKIAKKVGICKECRDNVGLRFYCPALKVARTVPRAITLYCGISPYLRLPLECQHCLSKRFKGGSFLS